MPEITPIAAAVPAAPAQLAGVAPATPAASDGTPSDFLGQLTAAVKSLKALATSIGVVPAAPAATTADPTAAAPSDDQTPPPAASDGPTDDVAELLASLGLVMLPQTPLQTDDKTVATADTAPQVTTPVLPTTLAPSTATDATTAPQDDALESLTTTTTDRQSAKPTNAAPDVTVADTKAAAAPAAPRQPQPATEQTAKPAPVAQHVPTIATADQSAFQQKSGLAQDDHHAKEHGSSSKTESIAPASTNASPQTAELSVQQPAGVAPPAEAQATNVASQIAQQVDLYRLPGNKGVRIQLHPDDLGGVQVTVRYSPGGNLELHINAEHAATGALVESGLSQLRDALATQGFVPDRVVMSVTAPAAAQQMDFSSNGNNSSNSGAYAPDAGFASFAQGGQSGQQRGADDSRGLRGWGSGSDASTAIDESPRAASTSAGAAASRIDYRV